ncbi:MAG: nitrous oxide reductase family maturation protein NosD, partial [Eudoraea sp.]|nr:nitrous oxide reductase family maturation protein NosD [Eudoraea sp.]
MRCIGTLFFTLLFLVGFAQEPKTIEICTTCEVTSIKEGVALAANFDTLLIKKGTYKEYSIVIDKPLVLLGIDHPVIDGEDLGEILRIESDGVTVDGLFIINVGTSYTADNAAIRVVKSKDFVIRNTVLEKMFFGIYLEKSQRGHIYNNTIKGDAVEEFNSGNGIQLWYCKDVVVEWNKIDQVRDGIYLEFSDNIRIMNNVSSNNVRYGLHFMFSNNDIYENNTFQNNGAGVAVMFSKHI